MSIRVRENEVEKRNFILQLSLNMLYLDVRIRNISIVKNEFFTRIGVKYL